MQSLGLKEVYVPTVYCTGDESDEDCGGCSIQPDNEEEEAVAIRCTGSWPEPSPSLSPRESWPLPTDLPSSNRQTDLAPSTGLSPGLFLVDVPTAELPPTEASPGMMAFPSSTPASSDATTSSAPTPSDAPPYDAPPSDTSSDAPYSAPSAPSAPASPADAPSGAPSATPCDPPCDAPASPELAYLDVGVGMGHMAAAVGQLLGASVAGLDIVDFPSNVMKVMICM